MLSNRLQSDDKNGSLKIKSFPIIQLLRKFLFNKSSNFKTLNLLKVKSLLKVHRDNILSTAAKQLYSIRDCVNIVAMNTFQFS